MNIHLVIAMATLIFAIGIGVCFFDKRRLDRDGLDQKQVTATVQARDLTYEESVTANASAAVMAGFRRPVLTTDEHKPDGSWFKDLEFPIDFLTDPEKPYRPDQQKQS
jgi:hypothetical protein